MRKRRSVCVGYYLSRLGSGSRILDGHTTASTVVTLGPEEMIWIWILGVAAREGVQKDVLVEKREREMEAGSVERRGWGEGSWTRSVCQRYRSIGSVSTSEADGAPKNNHPSIST